MSFSDLIAWIMRYFVGERSGRAEQLSVDKAAGDKETIDALQQRAKVDDAVRDDGDAARRRELRSWADRGPGGAG